MGVVRVLGGRRVDGCVVQPVQPELDGTFGVEAPCLSGGQGRTGQAAVRPGALPSACRRSEAHGVPAAPAGCPRPGL